jgi:hypothetical protein
VGTGAQQIHNSVLELGEDGDASTHPARGLRPFHATDRPHASTRLGPVVVTSAMRIVCALLGLWLALILVGFVVKTLLWLAVISLTAFVVTVAAGVGLAVHPRSTSRAAAHRSGP